MLLRERILKRDGFLCQPCSKEGRTRIAKEVDHIRSLAQGGTDHPSNLQAICIPCHRKKTAEESKQGLQRVATIPSFKLKPLIPVTIVCGPSGSGKSRYVKEHAGPNDLVLDLDVIKARLSGQPMHQVDDSWLKPALRERNAKLGALAKQPVRYERCWLIVSAPTWGERRRWKEMLNATSIVLAVDAMECERRTRVRTDPMKWANLAVQWWKRYTAGDDDFVHR